MAPAPKTRTEAPANEEEGDEMRLKACRTTARGSARAALMRETFGGSLPSSYRQHTKKRRCRV